MLTLVAVSSGTQGCWEQVSDEWFPHMKRQRAVQAFEGNAMRGVGQRLAPPEGAVPVDNPYPNVAGMELMAQESLQNPVPASVDSLEHGEVLFRRYCATCHGPEGHGNGPVAGLPFGDGPFGVVIPIGGRFSLANAFSDGHLYTAISMGRRRMPSYARIPPAGRWDLINYLRALNDPGGRP